MRKSLLLVVLFVSVLSFAQVGNPFSIFKVQSVSVPNDNDEKLENSLRQRINSYIGKSIVLSSLPFDLEVDFQLLQMRKAEAGLRIIYVAECELMLNVQNPENGGTFSSVPKKFIGNGDSEAEALANAILKVKPNDAQIKKIFTDLHADVLKFYNDNCGAITKKNDNLTANKKYGQAYESYSRVVEGSTCFDSAQKKKKEVYLKYITEICNKLIRKAELDISHTNYDDALDKLSLVDLDSPCNAKAKQMIASIESKILEQRRLEIFDRYARYRTASEVERFIILREKSKELNLE